ncbi:MAG: methanethiol S-methyltransferase [Myxococcota bacterium]
MRRIAQFLYGALAYAIFFGTFLYTAGFLSNQFVPKTIDSGETGSLGTAVAIDLVLLALFALQHSGMARPAFKRVWTRIVPEPIERATYVLLSCVVMIVVFAFWRPLPGTIWSFESTIGQAIGYGAFALGLATVFYSTLLIDHFELFGLRQVWDELRRRAARRDDFVTPSLYRYVRHPLYVGWFITLWATPTLTTGHLLFAGTCTIYILVAVRLEERDLVSAFGRRYEDYQAATPMFVPKGRPAPEAVTV